MLAGQGFDLQYNASFGAWNPLYQPSSGGGSGIANGGLNAVGQFLISDSTTGALSTVSNSWDATNTNLVMANATAPSTGSNIVLIGNAALSYLVDCSQSTVVGYNSGVEGQNSVTIGSSSFSTGNSSIAIGNVANANGAGSIYIGLNGNSNGASSIGIGLSHLVGGTGSTCLGYNCTTVGNYSGAFGRASNATNAGSFVFTDGTGAGNTDTGANQFVATFGGGYYLFQDNTPTLLAQFTPSGSQIIGTNTNDNAPAGYVGEYVESIIPAVSAVPLASTTSNDVTSISLTAGDWEVSGNTNFIQGGVNGTSFNGWISDTSATFPDSSLVSYITNSTPLGSVGFTVPTRRFSLTSTTTIYLSAECTFATLTSAVCGGLTARRVR